MFLLVVTEKANRIGRFLVHILLLLLLILVEEKRIYHLDYWPDLL